jgi:signal transduction histidine kinase/DNA-binding response OmpR family regulator
MKRKFFLTAASLLYVLSALAQGNGKARLKNHEWDETQIASLSVRIYPPLWLTWYAKLFYLLIACVAGFFLLKFYKNRLNFKTSLELERKKSQDKQELNDERLRFYTNITHELRTPLTLILCPLEDLMDTSDMPAPYKNKIQTIHGSAIRLLNLINKILEFRKTETQNRKLTVQKGNLACLVKEIGMRYKELNQNGKTDFHTRIETKDTVLYFDEDMITMILDNLLSNAAKYTPEGEIGLVLRSVEEKDNFYTEIEVSDTGYGIDKQVLPRIFDRYFQAKGKYQASGTGIGLALVKSLVELHEGILSVESTPGKGTVFRFRLLTGNTYPDALHSDNTSGRESGKEKTVNFTKDVDDDTFPIILVIEDHDEIREYIASSLSSGYTVYTATNGREGLELAQKEIPDIIVSDIMMPEMDGIELCRTMKGDIRTSHIPIILLTAKDSIKDKEEGYKSGADSYLTKPFSAKLLASRIRNILESREKIAEKVVVRAKNIKSKTTDKSQNSVKISRMDEEFLAKITALIEENLRMENLDISFLREKMNMSHSSFYRKIKALTGISANEFIRKIKIKNGLQLLLTGSYNISETAYTIGFSDVSYFSQCFKEEYGMLPSEYLKNANK